MIVFEFFNNILGVNGLHLYLSGTQSALHVLPHSPIMLIQPAAMQGAALALWGILGFRVFLKDTMAHDLEDQTTLSPR